MQRVIWTMLAIVVGALLLPAGWTVDRLVPSQYPTMGAAAIAAQNGDRIIVSGTVEETGDVFFGQSNLTLMGNPGNDVRSVHFYITGTNIVVQDLNTDGRNTAGVLGTQPEIFSLTPDANNITFERCRIVNPATRSTTGALAISDVDQHTDSGACIRVRTNNAVTIRDCDMICTNFPGLQNIVGVHFLTTNNGQGPYLIENTDIRVEQRGIDIQSGISNLTVRNCSFQGFSGAVASAGGVFVYTDDADPNQMVTNLLIDGCEFLGNGGPLTDYWNGILTVSGQCNTFTVRNCMFTQAVGGDDIYWQLRGQGLTIENNYFEGSDGITMRMTVRADTASNLSGLTPGDPQLIFNGAVIRNNNFIGMLPTGQAISFGEGFISATVVEDNLFTDIPDSYGFGVLDGPMSAVIRANHFERCATSLASYPGAITAVMNGSVVADNFILDCPIGIVVRHSRGLYANAQQAVDRSSTNSVLRRNIVINGMYGIFDGSYDVPATGINGRASNMRYANNTIVRVGMDCLAVHGDNIAVYNNILFGGSGSMNVIHTNNDATLANLSPDTTTTFVALGFNLTAGNQYKNITFPGGAQFPATDVRLPSVNTPLFTGGPFPTTRAGVVPLGTSGAIDAGSADGANADFQTDIGAIELGGVLDLSVPAAGWELYR